MVDNFENIIRKAVAEKVSQMANEEIDRACAAFRGSLLDRKREIVNKMIDGFRFVVKQDGINSITVQIIINEVI